MVHDSDEESIMDLVMRFKLIELLEDKEKLRKEFEDKVKTLQHLDEVDSDKLGDIYRDVITLSGPEPWDAIYNAKEH